MGNRQTRVYKQAGGAMPTANLPSDTQKTVGGSASRGYQIFQRADGSYIAQLNGGKTVPVVKAKNGYRVKGVEGRAGKLGEYAKNEIAKKRGVSARAAGRYIKDGNGENLEPKKKKTAPNRVAPSANNRRQRPQ